GRAARGRLRRRHDRTLRHPHRDRLRGQRGAPQLPDRAPPGHRGRPGHRDVHLPPAGKADLPVRDALTVETGALLAVIAAAIVVNLVVMAVIVVPPMVGRQSPLTSDPGLDTNAPGLAG